MRARRSLDGQSRQTGGQSGATGTVGGLTEADAQRDDVCVGLLHRHAQGVQAVLVLAALRRPSFQEQTHLPEDAAEEESSARLLSGSTSCQLTHPVCPR